MERVWRDKAGNMFILDTSGCYVVIYSVTRSYGTRWSMDTRDLQELTV